MIYVCLDHPGIIHKISGFLSKKSISIGEVKSKQFHAPHTGAIMFQGLIQIYIPSGQSIANLREEFAQYCDDENIDGLLEPVKH
jgi:glycine cleavage system transcriptional repressor